jgi:hypothetical protein
MINSIRGILSITGQLRSMEFRYRMKIINSAVIEKKIWRFKSGGGGGGDIPVFNVKSCDGAETKRRWKSVKNLAGKDEPLFRIQH